MKCCPPGKLIRDSVPGVFMGGWSHRHPEPSTYQEACLPEGKRTFNINHTVYISSLVRHSEPSISVLGMVGNRLKSKFPDTSQRPTLLAGLSKNSSLRPGIFCTAYLAAWHIAMLNHLRLLLSQCHTLRSISAARRSHHIISTMPQVKGGTHAEKRRTGASIYAKVCYLYL